MFMGICIWSYFYFGSHYPVPQPWMDKINEKCEANKVLQTNSWFYNGGILKICLFSSLLGAYYGLAIDSYFLGGTRKNVNDTAVSTAILRMIAVFLLGVIFTLPYFLMKSNNYSLL